MFHVSEENIAEFRRNIKIFFMHKPAREKESQKKHLYCRKKIGIFIFQVYFKWQNEFATVHRIAFQEGNEL
ncbi:hypothetical protein C5Q97_11445 [Victivallales bacterium CCUG 44730]|nr:hypothetical protein C5Q97_11445 [Victivallales bacterium CCUG 44730]